jgi:hypothetical protein
MKHYAKNNKNIAETYEQAIKDNSKILKMFQIIEKKYLTTQEANYLKWLIIDFENSGRIINGVVQTYNKNRLDPIYIQKLNIKNNYAVENNLPDILETYPKHQFLFVTLGMKTCNVENARSKITFISESFEKFIHNNFSKFMSSNSKYESGYFRAIEIALSNSLDAQINIHIHAILHLPNTYFNGKNRIKNYDLQLLWMRIINSQCLPNVEIKTLESLSDIKNKIIYTAKGFEKFYNGINFENPDYSDMLTIVKLSNHIKNKKLFKFYGTLKTILHN